MLYIRMRNEKQLKDYLHFNYLVENSPSVLEDFANDPIKTLERYGISEDAIACTEEEHKAFERAETFSQRITEIEGSNPIHALPKVVDVAREVFGKDVKIAREPFGLRFIERITNPIGKETTASATGTISFGGYDTDMDGDA